MHHISHGSPLKLAHSIVNVSSISQDAPLLSHALISPLSSPTSSPSSVPFGAPLRPPAFPPSLPPSLPPSVRLSLLPGDVNSIRIGSDTNIQDGSIVHVARTNLAGAVLPTIIGSRVTIGRWRRVASSGAEWPSVVARRGPSGTHSRGVREYGCHHRRVVGQH